MRPYALHKSGIESESDCIIHNPHDSRVVMVFLSDNGTDIAMIQPGSWVRFADKYRWKEIPIPTLWQRVRQWLFGKEEPRIAIFEAVVWSSGRTETRIQKMPCLSFPGDSIP